MTNINKKEEPIIVSIGEQTLHPDFEFYDIESNKTVSLSNLSKVNLFVGANNSGKSRLLRHILSHLEKQLYFSTELHGHKELLNLFMYPLKNRLERNFKKISIQTPEAGNIDLYKLLDSVRDQGFLVKAESNGINFHLGNHAFFQVLTILDNLIQQPQKNTNAIRTEDTYGQVRNDGNALKTNLGRLRSENEAAYKKFEQAVSIEKNLQIQSLYIPILRGLRNPNFSPKNTDAEKKDFYKLRTYFDFFATDSEKQDSSYSFKDHYNIFTGLNLYHDLRSMLLGDQDQRQKARNYEIFLSTNFFQGSPVTLTPREGEDVVYIKIGNEEDRAIYNLGDGIQAIICITFPLFRDQDQYRLVFIEEPETHLHPGMQRVLIDALYKHFPKHQFFISTHSNHILDLSLEHQNLSIYRINALFKNKTKSFLCRNIEGEEKEVLGDLGVRNSSVFLSNCTIWVEGITDRLYIEHYLKLYIDHLDESPLMQDFDYSYVEYAGSNITHWSFLDDDEGINVEALCGNLFLITDKDSPSKNKERKEKLSASLKERYYMLPVREIENTLSPEIIGKVVSEYEKCDVSNKFAGQVKTLKTKPIGKVIEDTLGSKKIRRGRYAEDSGTITGKVDFFRKAATHLNEYADLTDEAKDLAKEVYNFIKKRKI